MSSLDVRAERTAGVYESGGVGEGALEVILESQACEARRLQITGRRPTGEEGPAKKTEKGQ